MWDKAKKWWIIQKVELRFRGFWREDVGGEEYFYVWREWWNRCGYKQNVDLLFGHGCLGTERALSPSNWLSWCLSQMSSIVIKCELVMENQALSIFHNCSLPLTNCSLNLLFYSKPYTTIKSPCLYPIMALPPAATAINCLPSIW